MAKVETPHELLAMALQDLHEGEKAMVARLPKVRGDARDEELQGLVAQDIERSGTQRDRLANTARQLGVDADGEKNIWIEAILDDAANDANTIAAGPLRDTALVGALRKGKQSERVSYETAIALARRLSLEDTARTLTAIRAEEQAMDDALAKVLARLQSSPSKRNAE